MVTKVYRACSLNVKTVPKVLSWRRHVELFRPRYSAKNDQDPGYKPDITEETNL